MAEENEPTKDISLDDAQERVSTQGGLVASGAGIERQLMDHQPPTVTEKLLSEKRNLELRLQAINQLLDQMNANPATQQIIDGMAKLGALGNNY